MLKKIIEMGSLLSSTILSRFHLQNNVKIRGINSAPSPPQPLCQIVVIYQKNLESQQQHLPKQAQIYDNIYYIELIQKYLEIWPIKLLPAFVAAHQQYIWVEAQNVPHLPEISCDSIVLV